MKAENASASAAAAPAPHRSPTQELQAAYTALEVLVALVAVVGNLMVIHVFRRDRRLRRRTNYYIVSLAVADFLVGLLGIPFAILASFGLPKNLHACLFTTSLLVMLCTISIFCLVAVSVDRYWAILHPMCYSRNVRTKTAIATQAKIHGGPRGRFDKQPPRKIAAHHVTAHHTHYSYHPPSHINYLCRYCTSISTYPAYHGLPPTYVYKYRESNTKFGALLTGLALYNLGRSTEYWNTDSQHYTVRDDEKCSLQVIGRSSFEETNIPCFMLSSFLDKPEIKGSEATLDITTAQINIKPYLQSTPAGPPIDVNREQECVVWHNTTADKQRYTMPCALLKVYSETMKPAGVPVYVWLPTTIAIVVALAVCCQNCYRKKKEFKEDAPHHQAVVEGYLLNCNN